MQKIIQEIVLLFNFDTQIQFSCLHILGKYRNENLFNNQPLSVIASLVYLLQKLQNRAQDRINLTEYCYKISSMITVEQHQITDIQYKIAKLTKWKLSQPTIWNHFLTFALEWDTFTQTNSIAKIKFLDPSCPTLLTLSNNYCLGLVRNMSLFQYLQQDQFHGNIILQQRWKQISLVFLWIMIVTQSREICKQSKFVPYRSTTYIFKDFLSQLKRKNTFMKDCFFEQRAQKLLTCQFLPMTLSSSLQNCFIHRQKSLKYNQYFLAHQKTNKKTAKNTKTSDNEKQKIKFFIN